MDDGLKSEPTVEKAVQTMENARQICAKGNLRLHKITSNSKEFLAHFPESELSLSNQTELASGKSDQVLERTLGIQWSTLEDNFKFCFEEKKRPTTRRGLLSVIASLYDPLGFISPFILKGKQILQQTCVNNVEWDQPLDEELSVAWEKWLEDLKSLPSVTISRCFTPCKFGPVRYRELHHFSDASEKGYGTCTYIRSVSETQKVHCALVLSKARVAPKRKVTIPRLELQAAVLATKTASFLQKELKISPEHHFFWTDSRVVLGYIQNEAKRFHVYVANRIQQIRNVSDPEQWSYIDTKQNPADFVSRGLSVEGMMSTSWFVGPKFLWETTVERSPVICPLDPADQEVRANVHTCATSAKLYQAHSSMESTVSRMSSLSKLQSVFGKIIALARRKKGSPITVIESRRQALIAVARLIQQEHFNKPTPQISNHMRQLDVRKNADDVLEVGGRIENSSHSRKIVHPVVLPKESHLSTLIARNAHTKVKHFGRTSTIFEIRKQGFWIIGMRRVVDKEIKTCRTCTRLRGSNLGQKMADLPSDRLERTAPFTNCGIDCFGPFLVKMNRSQVKRYVLMVTCLSSRAVHTEVLENLSTDKFIDALRRLISLRGNIKTIRCDRGTNFVGACRELKEAAKEICSENVAKILHEFECEFLFNVPSASHMGGVWERQIRSVRNALFSLMQDQKRSMSDLELETLLREATAVVNNRPLTVDALESPDCLPLSPNQILTMKEEPIFPPPGVFTPADIYTRQRWRTIQYYADEFWSRWLKEYLSEQQKRQKWTSERRNVQKGDLVWLTDEMEHRSLWPLAKVINVYPSKDGLVRKVQLQRANANLSSKGIPQSQPSYLDRPVHKLVLFLPVEEQ